MNTAKSFLEQLEAHKSAEELKKYSRYFPGGRADGDTFIGVRMGQVFALAKESLDMPPAELEKLLESNIHEARAGALSTMDKQARSKKTTPEQRQTLYNLYIRRHDRINNWDLVDLACIYVVGGYLADKPRDILYKLARSKDPWERRTAIVSTAYFMMKQNEVSDTLAIAELLAHEPQDLVSKSVGWMLRVAGDVDRKQLIEFLDKHAATMPRAMLRNSLEHFDKTQKDYYMGLAKTK